MLSGMSLSETSGVVRLEILRKLAVWCLTLEPWTRHIFPGTLANFLAVLINAASKSVERLPLSPEVKCSFASLS